MITEREQVINQIRENPNLTINQRKIAVEGLELKFLNPEQAASESFVRSLEPFLEVGYHEGGHGVLVPAVRAERVLMSVIPSGNTLGFTRFNLTSTGEESLWDYIYIASGSRAGEETHGNHDHSGTTGDNSMIRYCSSLLIQFYHRSPGEIAAHSSLARRDVFKAKTDVTFLAWRLALNGTI